MNGKLRNPFRMRASERIESDVNFLRLFSPIVLESLIEKNTDGLLWNNILFIRSSPGGGKTSLLRIFEPNSLLTIYSRKSQEYRELYGYMNKLDAINDDGVQLLTVPLACTRNYELLDDLSFNDGQKRRIFYALLNSRITISTLKSISDLKKIRFPEDLNSIKYTYKNEENYFKKIQTPCTGYELYNWALDVERKIYDTLDSFLPVNNESIEGHDELFSLLTLSPKYFLYNDKPVSNKILFMLDDAHKLSDGQRTSFIKYLIERRKQYNIWISERKEVLDPLESLGSSENRDYEIINLEEFWQRKPAKFEKTLISIADKRARISTEDLNTFQENLDNTFDEDHYQSKTLHFTDVMQDKINKLTSYYHDKFQNWVKYIEKFEGSALDKAILLKKAEILIHRNLGKTQLAFDFPLNEMELLEKLNQPIEEAAKFFLCKEEKIPYYIGFNNLVKLASYNIEQFLWFAADLFEEMLSAKIAGNIVQLNANTQEKRIKKIVGKQWKELPRKIPYGAEVSNFLDRFGEFAKKETYRPNAPIVQGVTGFSIKTSTKGKLFNNTHWTKDVTYEQLLNVVSICVAFNLLEPQNIIQGKRGQVNRVFYLNRWLCVKFDLPFGYGGWKHKQVDDLLKWTKH